MAGELSPRRFQPDDSTRAIAAVDQGDWSSRTESGSAFERPSANGTLRWRVKQPTQAEATATSATVAAKPANAKVASRAKASPVRQAGGDDAFANPFGDKFPVRQVQAQDPLEEQPMGFNPPGSTQPGAEDEVPAPRPMFPRRPAPPAEDELQPMLPEPDPGAQLNNAKYNDRNCDADGKACVDNRLRLKSDILINKDNLLDITPPLTLPGDTPEQRERANQNFQRIPVRQWRDRAGEVVATGRLKSVAYRNATVITESGEEVKIPLGVLGDDEQCFLAGWWNVPAECMLGDDVHPGREFIPATMTWTASALCHKPLYFEEVQLERYGHTAGFLQPALSGAHFFVNIAILPYRMGINPPNECQYALGYYRPGSCAPWMVPPIPLSVRGAATQAAAVGIIAPLIP